MTPRFGSPREPRPLRNLARFLSVLSASTALVGLGLGAESPAPTPTPVATTVEDFVKQGNEARHAGQMRVAIDSYRQARDLAPRSYEIHVLLGDTLRRVGEADRAIPEYGAAQRIDPSRPEGYSGKALILRSRYDYEGAAAILQEGLGKVADASRPDLTLVLAETRRRQGRLPEARRLFEEILASRSKDAPARAGLARVAEDAGDLAGAIGAWDLYLEAKPDDVPVTQRREELRELRASIEALRQTVEKNADAGVWSELGRLQWVAGDLKSAVGSYQSALKIDPANIGARRGLAAALRDSGPERAVESARQFRRLLKQSPGDGVALYGLAALAAGTGADDEVSAWRDLVTARPDDLFALRGYLVLIERQGPEGVARGADRLRIGGRGADSAGRLRQKALLAAAAGRTAEAADLLYRLLLLDPTDPWSLDVANEILFLDPALLQGLATRLKDDPQTEPTAARQLLLARLTWWAGRGDEALAVLRRAVETFPGSAAAHSALAEATQEIARQPAEAILELQKAIELDPARPATHVDLALAHLRAGRPKLAEAAARRGLARAPGFAPMHSVLGAALADQGDYEGAVAAYNEALSSDPADNLSLARAQLPLALAALGRNVEARRALRGLVHPDPDILYREAWAFARDSCRDRAFNGQDWVAWKTRYLGSLKSEDDAYRAIASMLGSLGDPYTRLRDPDETAALFLSRRGASITTDPMGRATSSSKTVVTGDLPGGLGYIRLSNFTDPKVVAEVRAALEAMRRKEGLVLDLRGNSGGLSRAADAIGDLLVGPGKEAGVDDSAAGKVAQITGGDGALTDGPITVLVDGQTGSAAERLARALAGTGRATLEGDPTFGKGRAQMSRILPGGTTVLVSATEMLGPDGKPLQGHGLRPQRRDRTPAPAATPGRP